MQYVNMVVPNGVQSFMSYILLDLLSYFARFWRQKYTILYATKPISYRFTYDFHRYFNLKNFYKSSIFCNDFMLRKIASRMWQIYWFVFTTLAIMRGESYKGIQIENKTCSEQRVYSTHHNPLGFQFSFFCTTLLVYKPLYIGQEVR